MNLNKGALKIFEEIVKRSNELECAVSKQSNGTTILDAGINVPGSNEAGRLVSEICLGGAGEVSLTEMKFGDITLPAVSVKVEKVTEACLCSQYAGWTVKVDKYFAMASGPARALARVEKLYKELGYTEESDVAVVVLETREFPPEEVTKYIADKCGVPTSGLYIVVAPTACLVGSVQISARIVEVGVHKLHELKFNPWKIKKGEGVAPIAPIAKNDSRAMGVTNDCILFTGSTSYEVETSKGDNLADVTKNVPSSTSEQYGTPFYDLFKSVGFDFYKVDPLLFSPAQITIKDIKSGKEHKAGKLDPDLLKQSLGL
ncbi:methenyltetrahydromethanopterin cyclohydrolase [Candidatus Thorarchaeota archaeon]|nr:MAG: methenyltetrahydromethanopterin cyclohydrolase [Candidatus Thorarchaeota archaeon]